MVLNENYARSTSLAANDWYFSYTNIFSNMPVVGGSGFGVVGGEINRALFKAKFTCSVNWLTLQTAYNLGTPSVKFTVMLIASQENMSGTTPTAVPAPTATTAAWFFNTGYRATINSHNARVLRKWSLNVVPPDKANNTGNVISAFNGQLKYQFKRKIRFEDPGGAEQTTRFSTTSPVNFFLIAGYSTNVPIGGFATSYTPVEIRLDRWMYFKDG